jgi:hypothetical protein
MKVLFFIALLFLSCTAIGQPPVVGTNGNPNGTFLTKGVSAADSGYWYRYSFPDTASANKGVLDLADGISIRVGSTTYIRYQNKWWASGGGGGSSFNGNRPITRDVNTILGLNLGTTTLSDFEEALWFPSQVPTSALTATYLGTTASSFDLELMSSGSALAVTLNWVAGRQAATLPLSTVVVDGINESFSQPTAPGVTGASQAGAVTRNTNKTFSNVVTTTDGKTATSTTTFNWYAKKYSGYTSNASPSSANIVAAAGGGVNGFFPATSANGAFNVVVTGSNQYVFYAYPVTYGALTSIIISGLESIGAFTRTTVAVTNAGGFVQNYYCYTTNNVFFNTTIAFISVN